MTYANKAFVRVRCVDLQIIVFILPLLVLAVGRHGYAQTPAAPPASVIEPENLPLSAQEFRANMRKSNLIVRGRIVHYEPPSFKDHSATTENTTILVSETYVGKVRPGTTLTFSCVCSGESSSTPSYMEGHDVIAFLYGNLKTHVWSPATGNYRLFYHEELRKRILRYLEKK